MAIKALVPVFPGLGGANTLLFDGEIQVDQKTAVVLAHYEITDGDVSVKEAGFLPQRLVPFNAVGQRSE